MADPKARKVIVVENAFLSAPVKAMIARVLFDNLRVSHGCWTCGEMVLMWSGCRCRR